MAWQVAHELRRQGEDVTVVAREAEPSDAIAIARVAVAGRRSPLRALAFSRAAAEATRGRGFDVVHSFSRTRHQDLFRAGGGSHEDYLRRTVSPLGRAFRRLLPRHRSLLELERAVFADPGQRIQCASRLVADRLCAHHGVDRERILLLPNAVDANRFEASRQRVAARALRREVDAEAETIWLFPASGWHRKGLDLCLEALARGTDPGLHLWIAGRDTPGPWQRRARRAGIAERVRFLGPRRDLEVVYAAVDGMLLPTRYDAFANVTFEAAAAGLPIVTSSANGAAEWLSREARLVVDRPDGPSLAAALRTLATSDARRKLGDAARREIAAFPWPAHVAALRAEYARIVSSRGARNRQVPH